MEKDRPVIGSEKFFFFFFIFFLFFLFFWLSLERVHAIDGGGGDADMEN